MSQPHLSYSVNVVAVYSTCDKITLVVLEEACLIAIMSKCCSSALTAVNEHTHSRDSSDLVDSRFSRVSTNRSNHLGSRMCHRAFSLEFRLPLRISCVLARNGIFCGRAKLLQYC